jgi:hypothetical protein
MFPIAQSEADPTSVLPSLCRPTLQFEISIRVLRGPLRSTNANADRHALGDLSVWTFPPARAGFSASPAMMIVATVPALRTGRRRNRAIATGFSSDADSVLGLRYSVTQ